MKSCFKYSEFFILLCTLSDEVTSTRIVSVEANFSSCSIRIPSDIPKNEPLYLNESNGKYELYQTRGEINNLPSNARLILFCPGRKNEIAGEGSSIMNLTCKRGQFSSENRLVEIQAKNCSKLVTSEVNTSDNERCASARGEILAIGYRIDHRNFISLFKICFEEHTEVPIYGVHTIQSAIKYSVRETRRPNFRTTGMSRRTRAIVVYTKKSQFDRFSELLGSNQNFVNSTSFLARGHLTPDADFIFPSTQFSTYYYINVSPQFQSINAGNWLRVEKLARMLASYYESDLLVYSGTFDTLKLPNEAGVNTKIYLQHPNKFPVPKWFWKVIKHKEMDAAIVFITLNNPFVKRHEIREFCPSVCERAGVRSKHFSTTLKGFTSCCELNTFKTAIPSVLPDKLTASKILNCKTMQNLE